MSRASVLTMPAGVCAGAQIPYQIGKSKPATPACVSRKPHRLFHPERIRRGLAGGGPSRQVIAGRAVLRGDSGAGILGRTAQAAPCSDGVYGGVAGLPHGRAYGVGSDAGQAGDAVAGGGLGYREGDLRRGGADVIDRW